MSDDNPSSTEGPSDNWMRRLGRSLAGAPRSREELSAILREARQFELMDADAQLMIEGVLKAADTPVEHIMIPRSQMVVIEHDMVIEDVLRAVVDSGHSRFPVIGENRDHVLGILLAKDLLKYAGQDVDTSEFRIQDCLRKAEFVPENKRLNVLLKEFRSGRNHMAMVVDEYGGVSGLVTIEDVLETIVGDIDDEYDETEGASILRQDSRHYLVKGLCSIEDFNTYFGATFSDQEFDTLGGLVTHHFGRLPKSGETLTLGEFEFQVARADSRRLAMLRVTVSGQPQQD
ncbi:HlyC/CorC family transporter [Oceanococcus atlanticus]|nr:transporter associated domain-containing protein [Oceanococcus atlanticus]RZO87012.1 MAG: CBS domain-containing protein [Oceanococcus sp.]